MPKKKETTVSTAPPQKQPVEVNTKKNLNNNSAKPVTYYGARTTKVLENFLIGEETMPRSVIKAMGLIKKAATITNEELKLLSRDKALKIIKATDEVINGNLDDQFPLTV